MKKLKIPCVWAAVGLAVCALALGGCDDSVPDPGTDEPGAAIVEPWTPTFDGTSASGFSITSASAATVSTTPVNTGQIPEYAVSTTTTAPTSGWQTALAFTGLQADTTYNVFARSAPRTSGTVRYAAGTAVRGENTAKTDQEGEETSINSSWEPDPVYSGTSFTFTAATPAAPYASSHQVQYTLNNSNERSSLTTSTTWITTRSYQLSRLTSTAQYYLWARTAPTEDDPAGVALYKELWLPGGTLTGSFNAQPDTSTTTSATFTVSGADGLTKTPDIAALVIEYGFSRASEEPSNWAEPNASGVVTITGLAADTPYYLWARTKSAPNFRAGAAIAYSNSVFMRTSRTSTSVNAFIDALNRMPPVTPATGVANASFDPADTTNTTVVLLRSLNLNNPIDIPAGVTLAIGNGIVFNDMNYPITGSGTISLTGTGKMTSSNKIRVTVDVSPGAEYTQSGMNIGKTPGTPPDPPFTGVLDLSSGFISVKHNDESADYTLIGKATSKKFSLDNHSSFTIGPGGELDAVSDSTFYTAGTIEVQSQGRLVLSDSLKFKFENTTAKIIIHPGAQMAIGSTPTEIFTISGVTPPDGEFFLETSTARVEVTNIKEGETFLPRFTLVSGTARFDAEKHVFASGNKAFFEVGPNGTLVISPTAPATTKTLTVQNRLVVNGIVNVRSGAELKYAAATPPSVFLSGSGTVRVEGKYTALANFEELINTTTSTSAFTGRVTPSGAGEIYVGNGSVPFIGHIRADEAYNNTPFRLSSAAAMELSSIKASGNPFPLLTLSGGNEAVATLGDNVTFPGRLVIVGGETNLAMSNRTLTLTANDANLVALENNGLINGGGSIVADRGAVVSGERPVGVNIDGIPTNKRPVDWNY